MSTWGYAGQLGGEGRLGVADVVLPGGVQADRTLDSRLAKPLVERAITQDLLHRRLRRTAPSDGRLKALTSVEVARTLRVLCNDLVAVQ